MGTVDEKGAHCMLKVSTSDEVDAIEAEVSAMVRAEEAGEKPACIELTLAEKKKLVLKTGEVLTKPYDDEAILRAWYGVPGSEWTKAKGGLCCGGMQPGGVDVSAAVKKLLKEGKEVKADEAVLSKKAVPGGNSKVLLLELAEDEALTYTFFAQPLGINFSEGSPIAVSGLTENSIAAAEGVKKGMALKAVSGKDISGMTYQEATALLQEASAKLPIAEA